MHANIHFLLEALKSKQMQWANVWKVMNSKDGTC